MEMRALVRGGDGVLLVRRRAPEPGPDDVVLDVGFAGVCRTDLAVAAGELAARASVVLGHEFAGRVRAIGARVRGIAIGARASAIPFRACGACATCTRGERCVAPRWLGVDDDGAFADQVCVPASSLVQLPDSLPLAIAAYVEPLAAALGALPAIARGARVVVGGRGRIAELTARVVAAHGARVVAGPPCDVAIEHDGDAAALAALLPPGGTLVLKSRAHRPLALDAGELVARELVVRGASHGSFAAAVDWLHSGRVVVDDLLAPPRPLVAFADVLAAARASEAHKQLFAIAGGA